MSDSQITAKLLNAAELFHYANKFRGQVFIVIFKNNADFFSLVTDLKVIHKAQINLIVILEQEKDFLKIQEYCRFDLEFKTIDVADLAISYEVIDLQRQGLCPVINLNLESTIEFIKSLDDLQAINKLIFAGCYQPLIIEGEIKYFITQTDLIEKVEQNQSYNLLASYLHLLNNKSDLVLIPAKQGELFREIFTYLGAGTLVTAQSDIVFQLALLKQVPQIYYILLTYVDEGLILPISEQEIVERLGDFFVLSIEDEVIGVVSIKIYEQAAEIGKLCTLPRYRNKGLASSLIQQVIKYCQAQKLDYLFALSRNQNVLDIFRNFGFQDCPREELPMAWQAGYDFARPSRACRLKI